MDEYDYCTTPGGYTSGDDSDGTIVQASQDENIGAVSNSQYFNYRQVEVEEHGAEITSTPGREDCSSSGAPQGPDIASLYLSAPPWGQLLYEKLEAIESQLGELSHYVCTTNLNVAGEFERLEGEVSALGKAGNGMRNEIVALQEARNEIRVYIDKRLRKLKNASVALCVALAHE
ncbi:MAG: hypothetical protein M1839_004179 [Geoglossum umbratile]|nr:MAG: hypothetical protein M1839_004179 [Geoglossum umbratile]